MKLIKDFGGDIEAGGSLCLRKDALFNLPYCGEVFIEFMLLSFAKSLLKAFRVIENNIENALYNKRYARGYRSI